MTQSECPAAADIERMHVVSCLKPSACTSCCFMGITSLSVRRAPVVMFMKCDAMKEQDSGQTAAFHLQELAVNAVHQHSLAILSFDTMIKCVRKVSKMVSCVQLALHAVPWC